VQLSVVKYSTGKAQQSLGGRALHGPAGEHSAHSTFLAEFRGRGEEEGDGKIKGTGVDEGRERIGVRRGR